MLNEDYCRSIIESDLFQNKVKEHKAVVHNAELMSNYYEGLKDGILLAIRAFKNCDFTGYCNCPYCNVEVMKNDHN